MATAAYPRPAAAAGADNGGTSDRPSPYGNGPAQRVAEPGQQGPNRPSGRRRAHELPVPTGLRRGPRKSCRARARSSSGWPPTRVHPLQRPERTRAWR